MPNKYRRETVMNGHKAYRYGYSNGYNIASGNRPEDGTTREDWVSRCLETESDHFRQYSPFEFFANEVNNSPKAEEVWDRYDAGVYAGIKAGTSKVYGRKRIFRMKGR